MSDSAFLLSEQSTGVRKKSTGGADYNRNRPVAVGDPPKAPQDLFWGQHYASVTNVIFSIFLDSGCFVSLIKYA